MWITCPWSHSYWIVRPGKEPLTPDSTKHHTFPGLGQGKIGEYRLDSLRGPQKRWGSCAEGLAEQFGRVLRLCLHQLSSGVSESFCETGIRRPSMQLFWPWELKCPTEGGRENKEEGRGVCVSWPMLALLVIPLELHSLWTLTESAPVTHLHWAFHPLTLLPLELYLFFGVSHCFEPLLMLVFVSAEECGTITQGLLSKWQRKIDNLSPLQAKEINQMLDKPWVTYQRWEESIPWLDFYYMVFI